MNEPLNIRLASREMDEAGSTDGIWLKLPATAGQLEDALKRLGVKGGEYGVDYFITATESEVPMLSQLSLEHLRRADINELNYIAGQIQKTEPDTLRKLNASLKAIVGASNAHHMAENVRSFDYFKQYPYIHTFAKLGKYVFETSGLIQIPEEFAGAINFEKLGRLAAAKENGVFTEHGYVVPTGNVWDTFRETPQDYVIEQKPEAQEREPKRPAPTRMNDASPARLFAAPAQHLAAPISAKPIVLLSDNTYDKIIEITKKLEQGIRGIFESGKYEEYLKIISKFHSYSSKNCMLIALQKPYATHVAGFNFWRDHFNRHVKKGEVGIKILAPDSYKSIREVDKTTHDGRPVLDSAGRQVREHAEVTVPSFKVVSVFDVSQTYGVPLPEIKKPELTGSVEKYSDFFAALRKTSPVPIVFQGVENGVKGYFSPSEQTIVINGGMSELQNLKTAIHEIAHSRLHNIDMNAENASTLPDSRTREIEAESIAYTVCKRYGLDTSDYSFGFIAEWSGDKQLETLKSSLDVIRKEANAIITEVDKHFAEHQKHRAQIAKQNAGHTAPTPKDAPTQMDAPKQHHSAAVQMTVDASGKAEPPATAPTAGKNEPVRAPKPPAPGENVAAIEARVNAGEVINLTDLSDAMKKDKQAQAAQPKQQPSKNAGTQKPSQAQSKKAQKPVDQEKPSIREELAAAKRQKAAQKSVAKEKKQVLEV